MKKILLGTIGGVVSLIVLLFIFVQVAWDKNFEAPLPDLKAVQDSAVVARGRYLAYGPAHCASCHTPMDKMVEIDNGLQMPLQGGWELQIDPGTFRAPNITPDKETGIGNVSDGQIARALRYSVTHNNKIMFPFMPFQELSDEDVVAILSFLRSQPAVKNLIKPTELSFLGKALMALGVMKPVAPKNTPPKTVIVDSTTAYGEYLANRVANCMGCHTDRDLKTGEFTGVPFAGGFNMPADNTTAGYSFITPNLTSDKETGVITNWTEDNFIKRFKAGRILKTSPMPWGSFAKMDEIELKALYRYLKALPPTNKKIPKTVFQPGESLSMK